MPAYTIHTLDLHFQGLPETVAAFLVIGPTGPVLVESGPGSTLPRLTSELARFGVQPADVRDVLLTHIHLDHGGAAGWWAQQGAQIHVHHFGAPHLVDPSKLLASAQRIYGDLMQPLWGDYLASPVERVHAVRDGEVIEAGGLRFTALDTPGHARHHLVYQLDDVAFTGDLAGIRLSGRPHVRLPTPPPEFDLAEWQASLDKVRARNFQRLYLTHFGAVDDAAAHWEQLAALLPLYPAFVKAVLEQNVEREALLEQFKQWELKRMQADGLSAADMRLYTLAGPLEMSADGLTRYWKKKM